MSKKILDSEELDNRIESFLTRKNKEFNLKGRYSNSKSVFNTIDYSASYKQ